MVAQAHEIWWLFAALMPLNGAVFALDGILIGAGDTRFLMWAMLAASAVYIPIALLALDRGWGIVGVWWGLAALIAVRLATCGLRFASNRWALTGRPTMSAVIARLATLLAVVAVLVAAPAAIAQQEGGGSGAFGPLPEPAPAETATPTPDPSVAAQEGTDRTLLFIIGGGLVLCSS